MQVPAVPLGPALNIPDPFVIPTPVLELPSALIPDYEPLSPYLDPGEAEQVVLPAPVINEEEKEEEEKKSEPEPKQEVVKEKIIPRDFIEKTLPPPIKPVVIPPMPQPVVEEPETQIKETTTVQIPGTEIEVPVPTAEIMSAAATTSIISVGATLAATSAFKRLVTVLKPVIRQVVNSIQKLRGKKVKSWARQRLESRLHRSHKKENLV